MAHGTSITQNSYVNRATEPIERLILDLYISSRYFEERRSLGPFYNSSRWISWSRSSHKRKSAQDALFVVWPLIDLADIVLSGALHVVLYIRSQRG